MALNKVQYLKKKILEKLNKHRKEIGEQSFSALCNTVNGTNDYDKLLELNDMDLFIGLMDYMNNNGSNRINSGLEDVAKCTKKIASLPEFTKEEPEMLDGEISEDEYELMLEEDADKIFISSMHTLHTTEKDPVEIIIWRDVFRYLEQCADACEHVADACEKAYMNNT